MTKSEKHPNNILIIKLGALGDFVQATTAFSAIRQHYSHVRLTLLTTPPYEDFAKRLGCFDKILLDTRPKWYDFNQLKKLITTLRMDPFDCVFDLQHVNRTQIYKTLLQKNINWFSYLPAKVPLHPQESFQKIFMALGIKFSPFLDLTALAEPMSIGIPLKTPYALLVPGASAAHGGQKRWPEDNYAQLARHLVKQNIQPIIIGGKGESFPLIQQAAPESMNLVGKTTFYQVIGLAQQSVFSIGNDTGPMLLVASSGCLTLTFYSKVNPPSIGGARGDKNFSLFYHKLDLLSIDEVIGTVNCFF